MSHDKYCSILCTHVIIQYKQWCILKTVIENIFVFQYIYRKMCAVSVTNVPIPVSKVTVKSSLCGSKMFFVRTQVPFSNQVS